MYISVKKWNKTRSVCEEGGIIFSTPPYQLKSAQLQSTVTSSQYKIQISFSFGTKREDHEDAFYDFLRTSQLLPYWAGYHPVKTNPCFRWSHVCFWCEVKTQEERNQSNAKINWSSWRDPCNNVIVVDWFIFTNNQIVRFPCFIYIPKTGVGLPETGIIFYCVVKAIFSAEVYGL